MRVSSFQLGLAACLGLVASSACGGGGSPSPTTTTLKGTGVTTTTTVGGAAFSHHNDPGGFSLDAPASWTVVQDTHTGRVGLTAPDGAQVAILPVYTPQNLTAQDGALTLKQLGPALFPQATWQAPSPVSDTVVRMQGAQGSNQAVAVLTWKQTSAGAAGDADAFTADDAHRAADAPLAARIMASFRVRGAPKGQAEGPSYMRWSDASEGAYSLEAPRGWTVTGGTTRPSSLLVHYTTAMTSPDGTERVTLSNDYPFFTVPLPPVLPEGGSYSVGDYSSPVRSYAAGTSAIPIVLQLPAGVQQDADRPRPDFAALIPTLGSGDHIDAGEIEYHFVEGGVLYKGYILCLTEALSIGSANDWQVWGLYRAEAPATDILAVEAILGHAVATFARDPVWAARQAQTEAQQSKIIAQAQDQIGGIINSGWQARQSAEDEISRRRENATLGTVDVVDSQTGTTFKVDDSASYYWTDAQGDVLGTTTDTTPSADFRLLLTRP